VKVNQLVLIWQDGEVDGEGGVGVVVEGELLGGEVKGAAL